MLREEETHLVSEKISFHTTSVTLNKPGKFRSNTNMYLQAAPDIKKGNKYFQGKRHTKKNMLKKNKTMIQKY